MRLKRIFKENINIIIVFLMILLMSCFYLYVGDDWVWATSRGMKRFLHLFENYNGRYFSNTIIILIAKINIIRIFYMTFVTTGLILLVQRFSTENKSMTLLIFLLILASPVKMFVNTIAWASGFVNYVMSIFFVMLFLYLVREIDIQFWELKGILGKLFLIVLGFFSCLIVEHVTIYLVIMAVFFNIYCVVKYKRPSLSLLLYAGAVIAGCITMFSNIGYSRVINGEDRYREMAVSGSLLDKIFGTNFKYMYRSLIFENYMINILIVAVLIIICFKNENKSMRILRGNVFFAGFYAVYTIIKLFNPSWKILLWDKKIDHIVDGILTICYCIAILVTVLIAKNFSNHEKRQLVFVLFSAVLVAIPLLVVSPINARCFFPSYIFLIIFVVKSLDYLNVLDRDSIVVLYGNKIVTVMMVVAYIFWLSILAGNYIANVRRTAYFKKEIAAGKTVIKCYKLPYEEYIGCDFGSYPRKTNGRWQRYYKDFYHIDRNITIIKTDTSKRDTIHMRQIR